MDREKVIKGLEELSSFLFREYGKAQAEEANLCYDRFLVVDNALAILKEQKAKQAYWVLDEDPHDGDCRCSNCLIAIDAMHERNHSLLNALTGGRWWTFYKYCPWCGAKMKGRGSWNDS